MFKTLAFTAVVASVQALDALDTLTDQYTCTTTLADKSTFQLKDLESTTGYSKRLGSSGYGDTLKWNYCQAFLDDPPYDYYASVDYG